MASRVRSSYTFERNNSVSSHVFQLKPDLFKATIQITLAIAPFFIKFDVTSPLQLLISLSVLQQKYSQLYYTVEAAIISMAIRRRSPKECSFVQLSIIDKWIPASIEDLSLLFLKLYEKVPGWLFGWTK